jgi:hypothetical protein
MARHLWQARFVIGNGGLPSADWRMLYSNISAICLRSEILANPTRQLNACLLHLAQTWSHRTADPVGPVDKSCKKSSARPDAGAGH